MEKGFSYTEINFLTRELLLKHLEEETIAVVGPQLQTQQVNPPGSMSYVWEQRPAFLFCYFKTSQGVF